MTASLSLSSPFPAFPTHSNKSTFRCTVLWISQAHLCVEQGIHCCVIVAQLVDLKGKIKESSPFAMMLTSLPYDFLNNSFSPAYFFGGVKYSI